MKTDVSRCVSIPCDAAEADFHWTEAVGAAEITYYERDLMVDPDGSVLAWDPVAGHFSRHHDLTPEQIARAIELVGGAS